MEHKKLPIRRRRINGPWRPVRYRRHAASILAIHRGFTASRHWRWASWLAKVRPLCSPPLHRSSMESASSPSVSCPSLRSPSPAKPPSPLLPLLFLGQATAPQAEESRLDPWGATRGRQCLWEAGDIRQNLWGAERYGDLAEDELLSTTV
jgi:hypothetical protein